MGLKVLIVDDQQDTRELIALPLGRYGAEVRSSNSASNALEVIKDWRPNVVVSDIGLPEMDGYDFLRRLREIEGDGERIPAIAVTGYAGALAEIEGARCRLRGPPIKSDRVECTGNCNRESFPKVLIR